MTQRRKNIARWVLQGISILGIFFGFSWFCFGIALLVSPPRDDPDILWLWLPFSGVMLVLGAYLTYTSYLMLRGRAFGAINLISVLLAMSSFGLLDPLAKRLTPASVSENTARHIEAIVGLANLLLAVLVYSICTKLLKRLLHAAYSPQNTSGTQPSTDTQ